MRKIIENFVESTNAFDIQRALSLFASDAVIDDVSVGDAFVGIDGIRLYLERFSLLQNLQQNPVHRTDGRQRG
jgi:hypothetical protein